MKTFLEEVVSEISSRHTINDQLILVVPSKRASLFLLQLFAKTAKKPCFAPTIYTIEEFVSHLSGVRYASNTVLLFELYHVYKSLKGNEADSFYDFSKWGGTLLQDFNEIDRYLIPPQKLFSYLGAIQETNHWSLNPDKTPMIEAYVKFWKSLEPLYNLFSEHLLSLQIGYQGLVYRKASEAIDSYVNQIADQSHVFIGFNALNTAESHIFQTLLSRNKADIYWDIDPVFLEDPIHDAGFFIRSYLKNWKSLSNKPLKGSEANYQSEKEINIIGIPKRVSQAKYAGALLHKLSSGGQTSQNSTAVILGEENLLNPMLNAIPPSISRLNITMGLPLSQTPVAGLFGEFISLYVNKQREGWYHKDLISLVAHPYIKGLFEKPEKVLASLNKKTRESNWVYIKASQLKEMDESEFPVFRLLFSEAFTTPVTLLKASIALTSALKERFDSKNDSVGLEYLSKMQTVLNEISTFIGKYEFIQDLKSFQSLFRELMSKETVDFYGKPLEGIQLMGMLESRNLDFETVIITSLNEGILPSGKTNSSFIPFDLKREFRMPTYKEKDAVYTYHFYRLLQRAKKIYLLYNTEPDVLQGGERSRFISQLLTEKRKEGSIHHYVAVPPIKLPVPVPNTVGKDVSVLEVLRTRAEVGYSPSALATYIKDPIAFYKKYVLRIRETEEVEENIAANTFGTIIHASLESLYAPLVGSLLRPETLKPLLADIPDVVREAFSKHYPNVTLDRGKNLIAFQVIQRYLENFIRDEIVACSRHQIKLLAVEEDIITPLKVPGLDFPIHLRGTIDRIERRDGVIRILDYKTGNATNSEVEITEWEEVVSDPKKSKAFQMMSYALMYHLKYPEETFEAGIIPFRNMDKGVFRLCYKSSGEGSGSKKDFTLTPAVLKAFREQLHQLLLTLCDLEIPFEAKEE